MVIEALILLYVLHDLFRCHLLRYRVQGVSIADLSALHTHIALLAVYVYPALLIYEDSILRAFLYAVSALDAAVREPDYFLPEVYHLRIVAPSAVKWTSLKEDCRPYTRTVFSAEFLQRPHKSRKLFITHLQTLLKYTQNVKSPAA